METLNSNFWVTVFSLTSCFCKEPTIHLTHIVIDSCTHQRKSLCTTAFLCSCVCKEQCGGVGHWTQPSLSRSPAMPNPSWQQIFVFCKPAAVEEGSCVVSWALLRVGHLFLITVHIKSQPLSNHNTVVLGEFTFQGCTLIPLVFIFL